MLTTSNMLMGLYPKFSCSMLYLQLDSFHGLNPLAPLAVYESLTAVVSNGFVSLCFSLESYKFIL